MATDPWDELVDDPDCVEGDDAESHEVPGDLLELHLALEEKNCSPEDFKAAFGGDA